MHGGDYNEVDRRELKLKFTKQVCFHPRRVVFVVADSLTVDRRCDPCKSHGVSGFVRWVHRVKDMV